MAARDRCHQGILLQPGSWGTAGNLCRVIRDSEYSAARSPTAEVCVHVAVSRAEYGNEIACIQNLRGILRHAL